jgi:hypothetical protein
VASLPAPVVGLTACFLEEVDLRLPGRLQGLFLHGSLCWGEFFAGSDVDFVGMWDVLPTGADLELLRAAHIATRDRLPALVFDGFHCTVDDLAADPAGIAHRPVFYQGEFDMAGRIDISPVTWHELAERPIVVRGEVPPVHVDAVQLRDFTRVNLDIYWRGSITKIEAAGIAALGEDDDAIAWTVLGAARLHHLLNRGAITSKSGAGRYVIDSLEPRWHLIAHEALRLRESPGDPPLYSDPAARGRDMHDLLVWLVEDGTAR